ncbi:hypothetical protein N866_08515 [Actinotalea ferrariae CF5-4]|uniref:Uncharacterized protein n=1 Tax=Actinotalea ferrariae CF5-4 TaxID=948458 RepID=A0A021VML6_9CELL|nr:hypothetical protein N866_08515 [Actinotalea ferrariae CF5-4]
MSALGADHGLRGIEGAVSRGRGAVIAVSDLETVPDEEGTVLTQALAAALKAERVDVVVVDGDGLAEMVDQWAEQVVDRAGVSVHARVEDGALVLEVAGPTKDARAVVSELEAVDNARVEALERLLAYDGLVVRLA